MKTQVSTQALHDVQCDVLIVGAAHQNDGQKILLSPSAVLINTLLNELIIDRCNDGEFQGHIGELLTLHPTGRMAAKRVVVVGLGNQEKIDTQTLRLASAISVRHAQNTQAQRVALSLYWNDAVIDPEQSAQAQVEGALLGTYTFRQYQKKNEKNRKTLSQILILAEATKKPQIEQAVHKGQIFAEAANFARDLVNEPPCVLTPTELANRACTMAKIHDLECQIFDQAKIQQLGMGGLLAVSKGSVEPPQFIILRYRGAPKSKEKGIALVGKGITFDTGGISLKPAEHMDEMKGDMGGAAAVIGAMQAIAILKPAINVTALIPTCENMPGGNAYHPGDILRIMNGTTIEIVNTDAEGRLVLADALSYAVQEGFSPIVDLATLTGGIVIALGHTMVGLFCNDETLTKKLLTAGRAAGEKLWPMPLDDDYSEYVKSDIADIKQTGGRLASPVTAAKILEHFVGNTKWAHMDIAGTSYAENEKSSQEKGATGIGVRTLVEFVLSQAE
jgi:leucyl aminopeptidase